MVRMKLMVVLTILRFVIVRRLLNGREMTLVQMFVVRN